MKMYNTNQRVNMQSYIINLYKKHHIPLPKSNGGMITDEVLWGHFIEEVSKTGGYINESVKWGNIEGDINSQGDLINCLFTKVDKVEGKQLTTNDFTNALLKKLNEIEYGAEVNVNSDWNATSGDAEILNKPTIGDGSLKITLNTVPQCTFRANQSSDINCLLLITKDTVNLGNVDNTSDMNKPVSTATQIKLNTKIEGITAGSSNVTIDNSIPLKPSIFVSGTSIPKIFTTNLTATGNIGDNGNINSNDLIPIDGISTPNVGDEIVFYNAYKGLITTMLSTNITYIITYINVNTVWGNITGTLANQTDLQAVLSSKIETIKAGTPNINIDNSDPINPIISLTNVREPTTFVIDMIINPITIGEQVTLNLNELIPLDGRSSPAVGDKIIFENGFHAEIYEIVNLGARTIVAGFITFFPRVEWGMINGNIISQSDLSNILGTKIQSISSGSSNVIINNTDPINPIISVTNENTVSFFTCNHFFNGQNIGYTASLRITELTPLITGGVTTPSIGDIVILSGRQRALITNISGNLCYIILIFVPTTEWGEITGEIIDQTDLADMLDSKQGILTAGTNITIDTNNVISASGGISEVVWGDITGDITSQTDLYNTLQNKQNKSTSKSFGNSNGTWIELSTDETNALSSGITNAKVLVYDSYNLNKQDKITATGNTNLLVAPATVGGQPTLKPISDFQTALNRTIRFIGDTVSVPTATTDNGNDLTFTLNTLSAEKLKNGKTIAIGGKITGSATSFDGSGNITIPVTALSSNPTDYPILNQDTTGNAATASKWENERKIIIQGNDITGESMYFDGSDNITITSTLANVVIDKTSNTITLIPGSSLNVINNVKTDDKGRVIGLNAYTINTYDKGILFNPTFSFGPNVCPETFILGNSLLFNDKITLSFNTMRLPMEKTTPENTTVTGTVRWYGNGVVSAPVQSGGVVMLDSQGIKKLFEVVKYQIPHSVVTLLLPNANIPVGQFQAFAGKNSFNTIGGGYIYQDINGILYTYGCMNTLSDSAMIIFDVTLNVTIDNIYSLSGIINVDK